MKPLHGSGNRSAGELASFQIRALNTPTPVAVQVDAAGRPRAVRRRGWSRPRPVAHVQDRWRVDDEWWRERPIARAYYTLLLADGQLLSVYHDLAGGGWFEHKP